MRASFPSANPHKSSHIRTGPEQQGSPAHRPVGARRISARLCRTIANMTLTRTRGLARQKGVGREAFELKRERRMAVDVTERGQPSLFDAMEGLGRTARSAARHARGLAPPFIPAREALAAPAGAAAARPPVAGSTPVLVAPGEMRAGSLLLKSAEEGRYVEAPRLGT